MMKISKLPAVLAGAALVVAVSAGPLWASSHMDAPLITLDDAANTTDVYAFRSQSDDGETQYLTTALAVYPFEEPGIGPNNYRFDDNVLYEIHVSLGDDIAEGQKTLSYQFEFKTEYENVDTILQSYLGVIEDIHDDNQNLRQTYKVTMVDHRTGRKTVLTDDGRVPPNNQGLVTPKYNQDNDGEMTAKEGVASESDLDDYTAQAIVEGKDGYRFFAGQRDDGFYADIQSIFDVDFGFTGPNKPFDSQGGFNLHTIVVNIPLSEIEDENSAGVYATTSRRERTRLSRRPERRNDRISGRFVQVGRQGNPLKAEALIAIVDKDLYNRTDPTRDAELFAKYVSDTELGRVLNLTPAIPGLLEAIYTPDLIKVDLTTGPAVLAGQEGFGRLSVFGGDVLQSEFQDPLGNGGLIPGGWPNGRRFGDDVVDIALIAIGVLGVLGEDFNIPVDVNVDGVSANDITFNDVFPYAATPLNGRNHPHHGAAVLMN